MYVANTVTVTDAAGKWKKQISDAFGNLTSVEEPRPAGGTYTTIYIYDALNRLRTVTMARDGVTQTRTWTYDPTTQRLESVTMPESGTTTYAYNTDGTLLRRTDAKGQKVEYKYDGLRRLTRIERYPTGAMQPDICQTVNLAYGTAPIPGIQTAPIGRVTRVWWGDFSNPNACPGAALAEDFGYDKAGNVIAKEFEVTRTVGEGDVRTGRLRWEGSYDNEGRLAGETYPYNPAKIQTTTGARYTNDFDSFSYTYDPLQRGGLIGATWQTFIALQNTTAPANTLASQVTYTSAGRIKEMSYLGTYENRDYNTMGQMVRQTATRSGAPGMDLEYVYPATGLITGG